MGNCSTYTSNCDVGYVFTASLIIISFLFVSGFLINTIISFYCINNHKPPTLYFQITAIISFILGIGSIVCDFIHVMQGWLIPKALRSDDFTILRIWANIFAFNSYIATDLVIFGRLYFTFLPSIYKISNWTFTAILILIVSVAICDILYIIDLSPASTPNMGREHILISLTVIELTLFSSMSLMFTKKLHQLLSTSDDDQQDLVRNNKSNKMQFNIRQQRLLNLTTKNSIITAVAAIYFALRFCYREVAAEIDSDGDTEPIWMISYTSRTYLFVTNGIAVYFGFGFASKTYYKLFGKCHIGIFGCCAKIAKREITQNAIGFIEVDINEDEKENIKFDNQETVNMLSTAKTCISMKSAKVNHNYNAVDYNL